MWVLLSAIYDMLNLFVGSPGVKGDAGAIGPIGSPGLQGPRGESGNVKDQTSRSNRIRSVSLAFYRRSLNNGEINAFKVTKL